MLNKCVGVALHKTSECDVVHCEGDASSASVTKRSQPTLKCMFNYGSDCGQGDIFYSNRMNKETGNENANGILEKHWRTGFRFVPVKRNLSTYLVQWCVVLAQ